jgi:hypothetical protein
VCRGLLSALDVSEGRRKQRARDTAADAIGLGIKRRLLEAAVEADPDPIAFEAWLLCRCFDASEDVSVGATRAMAREIFSEWQLAAASADFTAWLCSLSREPRDAPPIPIPGHESGATVTVEIPPEADRRAARRAGSRRTATPVRESPESPPGASRRA